ncbi:MAG: DUF222 domain-containing protein [Vicinamibacterales bacterium]
MTFTLPLEVEPAPLSRSLPASDRSSSTDGLGEAIAELAARLHAATYELLVLLREFDERAGWNCGFLSCAHWLHWRTGIDLGAAREKVRVAKALAALPLVSAAIQRGAISYAKVRALTRVATPQNEAVLVDLALAGTAAHVERFVRAWRRIDRVEAARETEARHLRRELSTWVDDDGMVVIRGRLTPEIGAVVQRALEAAADRLFRESAGAPSGAVMTEEVTFGQRRADALGLLAEAALGADLDRGAAGDCYQVVLHVDATGSASDRPARELASDQARGPVADAAASDRVDVDSRAFNGAGAVAAGGEPHTFEVTSEPKPGPFDGTLELADGATYVSAETARRLACDASVVVMHHDPNGTPLDVGRKTRTIPPATRRALLARDTCCRFPGCTARRCDAHHVMHWADGGATRLDNLVRLCRRHHRAVHESGFAIIQRPSGALVFHRPNGEPLSVAPVLPRCDRPSDLRVRDGSAPPSLHLLGPVTAQPASPGLVVSARSVAVWDGTPFDVTWAIDVIRGTPGISSILV